MTALVTGASSGIGLHYATILARDYQMDMLLVSNQQEALEQVAHDLTTTYGVKAEAHYADLSQPTAAQQLYDYCHAQNMPIDVLVNNAGVLLFGETKDASTARISLLLQLHVLTLTQLCRLFAADMAERGKGYILNMSSMTAWMPMPTIACYNASKAYILNFSKALWYELRDSGVNVCAVTPGAVDTPLYNIPDVWRKRLVACHIAITPERLAKKALKALFKGKKQVMPGRINHLFVPFMHHLPDWLVLYALHTFRRLMAK